MQPIHPKNIRRAVPISSAANIVRYGCGASPKNFNNFIKQKNNYYLLKYKFNIYNVIIITKKMLNNDF